jgi:hypothetical protein
LQAAWIGGGLACAVLVLFALLPTALRTYDAGATPPAS